MVTAVVSGATLGLLNMVHCAAMCGPLSSAASSPQGGLRSIRYQLGRLASYGFLGAMSGHLGRALQLVVPSAASVWVVTMLTAAACLLTARSMFTRNSPSGLVQLGAGPKRRSVFALLVGLVPREPLVLGMLSALLPCGVLASSVLAAVATGDALLGMSLMLAFAGVSGVAVWGASLVIQAAPRRALPLRSALACALIMLAGLTLYRPLYALMHEPQTIGEHAACHGSTQ
jgi:sulfite exporter TauE/SafE